MTQITAPAPLASPDAGGAFSGPPRVECSTGSNPRQTLPPGGSRERAGEVKKGGAN
jgi:hypothetical protein